MSNNIVGNEIISRVAGFAALHGLFSQGSKYIVALSGGADSVALLLLMSSMGCDIEAAHCNFHLRGKESDRDEEFCISLCQKNGIPLHRIHFDTRVYASLQKISIEMAARELRYSYFEQLRNDINATAICVAHHQDDNVETILLNILRGTGINGLTGMAPRNGNILRPLLCLSRNDILLYLRQRQQDYVTDSSNLVDDVQRNKLRLNVIPLLEEINSSARINVLNMSRWITEAAAIVDHSLTKAKESVIRYGEIVEIDITQLEVYPSKEYLLWDILKDYGFNSSQITDITEGLHRESGTMWASSTHKLYIDRNRLLLLAIDDDSEVLVKIPEDGTYVVSSRSKVRVDKKSVTEGYAISRDKNRVCLDASTVKFPLIVRNVRNGDKFRPFGMKGTKLVSDFLTDMKMPLPLKNRQLVVTDADGNILWVVGCRPDGRHCITDHSSAAIEISLLS